MKKNKFLLKITLKFIYKILKNKNIVGEFESGVEFSVDFHKVNFISTICLIV